MDGETTYTTIERITSSMYKILDSNNLPKHSVIYHEYRDTKRIFFSPNVSWAPSKYAIKGENLDDYKDFYAQCDLFVGLIEFQKPKEVCFTLTSRIHILKT